jgi:hypothetical protein
MEVKAHIIKYAFFLFRNSLKTIKTFMYKEKGRKRKEKKRLTMLVREVHWSHCCALHAENKSKANPCFSSQDPSIFL